MLPLPALAHGAGSDYHQRLYRRLFRYAYVASRYDPAVYAYNLYNGLSP